MLIYMDGFEHYDVAGTTKYVGVYNSTNWISPSGNQASMACLGTMPVLGGVCLNNYALNPSTNNYGPHYIFPTTPVAGTTTGFGFHFYKDTTIGLDNHTALFGVLSGSTTYIGCCAISSAGQLQWSATSPNQTKLGNSGANLLAPDTLYHIEVQILWGTGTAGSVNVRVNGISWLSVASINTLASAPVYLGIMPCQFSTGSSQSLTGHVKNFYVYDKTGSINNNWLGERNVYTILPNADTADADWTKSTGSNGYALLDNVPVATGTDYIESTVLGDSSVFESAALPNPNISIIAIQTNVLAEKTDTGPGSIQFGPRSGGVDSLSASIALTQSQYLYYSKVTELNPNTGLAWTPADIVSLQTNIVRSV